LLKKPTLTSQIGKGTSKKKLDMATIFKTQAHNGLLDISGKNLSDMHANELAKCIK
jgi:hypothetical protein